MSKTLQTDEQRIYLASVLPGNASGLELLYRGSDHGWNISHFHSRCDGKGRTVTIFESDVGYLAAGYTSLPWNNSIQLESKADSSAFLCALTNKMQLFKPRYPSSALFHYRNWGPNWGHVSLAAVFNPMNGFNNGVCFTNDYNYGIPTDDQDNSVLTGQGNYTYQDYKLFTIKELEVFLVKE